MPHSSGEAHVTESNMEDYEYEQYRKLKKGYLRIKISNMVYRCPFCYETRRRDYCVKELLDHASGVGTSRSRSLREKAQHWALENYIKMYLVVEDQSEPITKSGKREFDRNFLVKDQSVRSTKSSHCEDREVDRYNLANDRSKSITKYGHCDVDRFLVGKDQSQPASKSGRDQSEPASKSGHCKVDDDKKDQHFVYPWVGIVANIKTIKKDGKYVGECGFKLRDELRSRGFCVQKVQPLWNFEGHSGFAIVEFGTQWAGFSDAILFEKSFEVDHHGKRDYYAARTLGDKPYGWVAKDDDYNSNSHVGGHLRKIGDLKTVSGKESEDQRKTSKVLTSLADTLETINVRLKEMQKIYSETNTSLDIEMRQKEMINFFNEEIRKMQEYERDYAEKIFKEHERDILLLDAKEKKVKERQKHLEHQEAQNENEKKKLHDDRRMLERANLEQKLADEKVLKLAEDHKKEKEKLDREIIELQKNLDTKQELELEIERMRGALQLMKHIKEDEDTDIRKKIECIEKELKEKDEQCKNLDQINQALVFMERKVNDELQDARQVLISSLRERSASRGIIGVKIIGALDYKPFCSVMNRRFPKEEAEVKAVELWSLWDDHLRDFSWHPFQIITDEEGNIREMINAEDEELKGLKEEYGEEVFNAVHVALTERNGYDTSGRFRLPELWNFRENRKATLKEGVAHILRVWRTQKRKREHKLST